MRFVRPSLLVVPFACVALRLGTGCLAPTEATLAISSDTCNADAAYLSTNITVVSRQTLAASDGAVIAPTASTQNCGADGGIGTLVVVPGPNGNGPIVVTVAMGVGINPNYCGVTDSGTHCIIETRELTLVDNEPFTLPIQMLKVCEGVYCPPGQTCVGPDQCGSDQVSMTDCPNPHTACLVSTDAGRVTDAGVAFDTGAKGPDGSVDATIHEAGHDAATDATMHANDAADDVAKQVDAGKDTGSAPLPCNGQSIDAGCLEQIQGNQSYPWAIAAYGGRVYWTSGCQDQGFVCTPDGAVWSANGSLVDAGETIATHQNGPTAISVSDSGVYWTTRGTCVKETGNTYNCTGTVMRAALDGGAGTTIAGATSGGAGQESAPLGIVALGSTLYWVDNGIQYDNGSDYVDASGTVNRAGTGIAMPQAIVTGQQGAGGIAVDQNAVFWTNFGPAGTGGVKGTVMRSSLDGGAPSTLASDQDYIVNVAVADASVYWLTQGYGTEAGAGGHNGALQATSVVSPGMPVTLASQLGYEWNLAIDDHAVYWADPVGGSILRTSRTKGGSPVILVSHLATPTNVFLEGGVLYWVNNGTCTDAGKCSGSIMKLTLR